MSNRSPTIVLGRLLGTSSGWDGDMECHWEYDFEPAEGVGLPACSCLNIEYSEGKLTAQDAEGETLTELDMATFCAPLPHYQPA